MGSYWSLINHTLKELPQNIRALPDKAGYYRLLDVAALATVVHNLSPVSVYLPSNKKMGLTSNSSSVSFLRKETVAAFRHCRKYA